MVPLPAQATDGKRQLGAVPLERAPQGGPRPPACRGPRSALIPLLPERLGPRRALLVIERGLRLDGTKHLPVPTATAWAPALGSRPTVKEHLAVDSRGPQPRECPQHVLGPPRFLAQTPPRLGGALLVQTPPGLLPQGEAPILGIGACPVCEADCDRHRPMGVAGGLLPLALGVIVMRGHGCERSRVLVVFAPRAIQTHLEGPWSGLLGRGHPVGHAQAAHRCPEVLRGPGAQAERIGPLRGVGGSDTQSVPTGQGFMACVRDHQRLGEAQHLRHLRGVSHLLHLAFLTGRRGALCQP